MIEVDAKRLLCPMPVIRLSEAINKASKNDLIKITATDPGVLFDIPAWCKVHRHKIIRIDKKIDEIFIIVEKIG